MRASIFSPVPAKGSDAVQPRQGLDVRPLFCIPRCLTFRVHAGVLVSAGHTSAPRRPASSLLHDVRALGVRSRRLRGSPVSLLRVRLQRIHTGRHGKEARDGSGMVATRAGRVLIAGVRALALLNERRSSSVVPRCWFRADAALDRGPGLWPSENRDGHVPKGSPAFPLGRPR
jgi:hypothetical protein